MNVLSLVLLVALAELCFAAGDHRSDDSFRTKGMAINAFSKLGASIMHANVNKSVEFTRDLFSSSSESEETFTDSVEPSRALSFSTGPGSSPNYSPGLLTHASFKDAFGYALGYYLTSSPTITSCEPGFEPYDEAADISSLFPACISAAVRTCAAVPGTNRQAICKCVGLAEKDEFTKLFLASTSRTTFISQYTTSYCSAQTDRDLVDKVVSEGCSTHPTCVKKCYNECDATYAAVALAPTVSPTAAPTTAPSVASSVSSGKCGCYAACPTNGTGAYDGIACAAANMPNAAQYEDCPWACAIDCMDLCDANNPTAAGRCTCYGTCNFSQCSATIQAQMAVHFADSCDGVTEKQNYCIACNTGYYKPEHGATACSTTDVGHIAVRLGNDYESPHYVTSSVQAADYQKACGVGQYNEKVGYPFCNSCTSGKYSSSFGSSACDSCPAGTVAYASTTCYACYPGTTIDYFADNCQTCAAGYYTPTGNRSTCLPCPAGKYGSEYGLCSPCETGYSSVVGSTVCSPCNNGFEPDLTADPPMCIACGEGMISPASTDPEEWVCEVCDPGYYPNADRNKCEPCPAGRYATPGNKGTCDLTPAGTYTDKAGTITPTPVGKSGAYTDKGATAESSCLAGYYAIGTAGAASKSCSLCPPGKYQDKDDAFKTGCIAAPAGKYISVSGAGAGLGEAYSPPDCPPGRFTSTDGSSYCNYCPAGEFSAADGRTCNFCNGGKFSEAKGSSKCENCPAGKYTPSVSSTGYAKCEECADGTASLSGSTECKPCATGSYARADRSECITQCPAGYTKNTANTQCQKCSAGKYLPSTSSSCLDCEKGKYSKAGDPTACTDCTAGRYSDITGSSWCSLCPAGKISYFGANSECFNCGANQYSNSGDSACTQCPAGSVSSAGDSTCTPCNAGSYADTSCYSCPAGKSASYTLVGTEYAWGCDICPLGKYSSDGARDCTDCSPGRYTPKYKAGLLGQPNACDVCPPGRFSLEGEGYLECTECAAGKYSASGETDTCTPCTSERFSYPGASVCFACNEGMVANSDFTACVDCPNGMYRPLYLFAAPTQPVLTCLPVPAGYYGSSIGGEYAYGSKSPVTYSPCPRGRYSPTDGPYDDERTECLSCEAGTYNSGTGQSACTPLTPGYEGRDANNALVAVGATKQTQCKAGYFRSGGTGGFYACSICPKGTYSSIQGASACLFSPDGTSGSVDNVKVYAGATSYDDCEVGTRYDFLGTWNQTKADVCSPCRKGYFQSQPGLQACDTTLPGHFAADIDGNYVGYGAVRSMPCPAGKYQTYASGPSLVTYASGAALVGDCTSCPFGTYTKIVGATHSANCSTVPLGQQGVSAYGYMVYTGAADISPCPVGKYGFSSLSANIDVPADTGAIIDTGTIVVGTSIDSGVVAAGTRITLGTAAYGNYCQPCTTGTFANTTGLTVCSQILLGQFSADKYGDSAFYGAVASLPCPVGRYSPGPGATECTLQCEPGTYADTPGSSSCLICPAGKYQSSSGASACTACATGYTSAESNPPNRFDHDQVYVCNVCAPGWYSAAGQGDRNGNGFGDGSGNSGCIKCDPSTLDCGGASAGNCPMGYNGDAASLGANPCTVCKKGTFNPYPGNKFGVGGECSICADGTYSDMSIGQWECSPCASGYTTFGSAATDHDDVNKCNVCAKGYYSDTGFGDGTGNAGCTVCSRGEYQEKIGQTSCNKCKSGSTTSAGVLAIDHDDSSDCATCPYGYYTNELTQPVKSECTRCESGKYPSSNKDQCLNCPAQTRSATLPDGVNTVLYYGNMPGTYGYCQVCSKNECSDPYNFLAYCPACPAGVFAENTVPSGQADASAVPSLQGRQACPAGSASPGGKLDCVLCAKGSYAATEGQSVCTKCPGGRPTPGLGTTDVKLCVSPETNFYTGFFVLGLVVVVALEYVIHGRFHRIAFLRKVRVASRLVKEARSAMPTLYYFATRAEAERQRNYSRRLLKTWLFLLSWVILGLAITLIIFIASMGDVFFKSMIIWRGLDIDLSFITTMVDSVKELGRALNLPSLQILFYPFQQVFNFFSSINLSEIMASVNVTCAGASAPLELLSNLLILGVTIIVIESNFQLFRAITFNSITDKFIESLTQASYKAWVYRNNGTSSVKTRYGWYKYLWTVLWVVVVRVAGGFDFFTSMLQFMMSVISLSKFANSQSETFGLRYTHAYSPECNDVVGFEKYDEKIALYATIEAYIMIIPAVYEVSKVLLPGLPSWFKNVEDIDKKRDPKWSYMHVIKYTSWMMPELWLSVGAARWVKFLKNNIPTSFGKHSVSLTDQEVEDRKAHAAEIEEEQRRVDEAREAVEGFRGSILEMQTQRRKSTRITNVMASVTAGIDDVQVKRIVSETVETRPAFRIVSTGTHGQEQVATRRGAGLGAKKGFYFAKPGYAIKIWDNFGVALIQDGYYLAKVMRATGECLFVRTYDIHSYGKLTGGRTLENLVEDLNECTDEHLLCVFTTGDPEPDRLTEGLPEALYRCGASSHTFGEANSEFKKDSAYVLIGVGGCGEGSGFEALQGPGAAGIHAVIDIAFEATVDGFKILDAHKDGLENNWCCGSDSFILSSLQQRTPEENFQWKQAQKKSLPSYWTLCKLELQEMCASSYCSGCPTFVSAIPCLLLVIIGLGHILTKVGRRCWFLVLWKFWKFVLLCLGVWTDDVVDMFRIHETIREMSIVWDKPFRRKSAAAYQAYREKISQNRRAMLSNKKTSDPNSRPFWSFKHTPLPSFMTPSDVYLKEREDAHLSSLHHETDEMTYVQLEESKRKLRRDYAAIVSAIVSTRAVILQVIPILSIASIFASTMSTTPIFVWSERLNRNLPELIISEPFTEARAQEQELIDETEFIRKTEVSEEQNCVPNPYHKMVKGKLQVVSPETRAAIEKGNEYSRAKMRRIINMRSRKVDEWVVAINGFALYVTESRFINFVINLYRFILTIGLLYTKASYLKYWMMSAVVILIPYAWLLACKFTVIVGKAMYVTDEDLWQALNCVGLACVLKWLTSVTGTTKELGEKVKEEDYVSIKDCEDGAPDRDAESSLKDSMVESLQNAKDAHDDEDGNDDANQVAPTDAAASGHIQLQLVDKDTFTFGHKDQKKEASHPELASKRGIVALAHAHTMELGQRRVAEVPNATRSVVVHEGGVYIRAAPSRKAKVLSTLEAGDECSLTAVRETSKEADERLVIYGQLLDGNWAVIEKPGFKVIRSVADVENEAQRLGAVHDAEATMLDDLVKSVAPNEYYESCWPVKPGGVAVREMPDKRSAKIRFIERGVRMSVVGARCGPAEQPGTAWVELQGGGWFPLFRDHVQGLRSCVQLEAERLQAKQTLERSAKNAGIAAKEKPVVDIARWKAEGKLIVSAHVAGKYKVLFPHGVHFRDAPSRFGAVTGGADFGAIVLLGPVARMADDDATVFAEMQDGGWVAIYKHGDPVVQNVAYVRPTAPKNGAGGDLRYPDLYTGSPSSPLTTTNPSSSSSNEVTNPDPNSSSL